MTVFPVRHLPEPVLRGKAKKVRTIDVSIKKLVTNMIETMHAVNGVGLAAPQIGVPLRVIVIGIPEQKEIVLINPEIVKKTGEREIEERCLSVPGYAGQVKRAMSVTVKGKDLNGKEIRVKGEELLAQALEHEIDHLNGTLYVDHMDNMDKLVKVTPQQSSE